MIEPLDCLPCLSRQAALTARLSTPDAARQQAGLGEALMHLAMTEPSTPLPAVVDDVQRTLARHTGSDDPYFEVRERLGNAARSLLPALLRMKRNAEDPWAFSVLVSAAGNLLEEARDPAKAGPAMDAAWQATARGTLAIDHVEALKSVSHASSSLLFLADNAGEIVWDSLLIDLLGPARVTIGVQRQPCLHNATADDLSFVTWPVPPRIAVFEEPPPGYPSRKPPSLDRLLAQSDLVVAKGSEWFERLSQHPSAPKRFHILAPFCSRVAARLGVEPRELVATLLPS